MTGEKGYKMADVLSKLGASNPCSTKVNPIVGNYSAPRELYKHIWTEYDLNQYCNYLIWDGLPEGLTSWNLNRMLYFRGSLAGFKLGGDIYILPYVITGGINCYGLPNAIQPITFNGGNLGKGEKIDPFGKELKLPMGRGGVGVEAPGAVILYDSVPWAATMASPSRYTHNQVIINEIAETLARININMVVANKKFFFVVRDESQAQVVRFELNQAFSSDSPLPSSPTQWRYRTFRTRKTITRRSCSESSRIGTAFAVSSPAFSLAILVQTRRKGLSRTKWKGKRSRPTL